MPLLTLADANLAYGHVALLDHAELFIESGERIALIGRNGSGKSSLLRVLAAQGVLDDGRVQRASGLVVTHVPQEPQFEAESTIEDIVTGDGSVQPYQVAAMLDRMRLDADALIASLSGGTLKRVALARALVAAPQLLLLDEPTNHLDLDAIGWLEGLIQGFRGAVVVVTHDRRFLDAVATRIIELDRGILRSYPGRFVQYQTRKADELSAERAADARFDKMLAQEEVWIRKGVEARRTRNEGRVRRLEQLRRDRASRRDRAGNVTLAVADGERSGKLVAELVNVSKAFDDQVVVREFSTMIMRGDRIGLIGPNGAGKTTLLKLLLGEIAPDSGQVRQGTNLTVAYFDQFRAQLNLDATLADTISPGSDWVEVAGARKHIMSYLSEFLFPPERARSPVRTLSGGERNRLLLARLFAKPANVLVLDEPTNDLDIETLELLEALLQDYAGTVLVVSHDRAFLDAVVTQTIAAEGDGAWREYAGGYEDYVRALERTAAALLSASKQTEPAENMVADSVTLSEPIKPRVKRSYKETRELAALPLRIEALETEQRTIATQLNEGAIYRTDPARARELNERNAVIELELIECLQRWETLEGRQ